MPRWMSFHDKDKMRRSDLERIIQDLEISPEIKQRIDELLATIKSDEISGGVAGKIKSLLELEADLLDIKAGIFDDLSEAASQFVDEASELSVPDFGELVQRSEKLVGDRLSDFEKRMMSQIDAFAKEKISEG